MHRYSFEWLLMIAVGLLLGTLVLLSFGLPWPYFPVSLVTVAMLYIWLYRRMG
jgi:hypothetical protein